MATEQRPAAAGWRDAWVAALDELEADVGVVEAALEDEHRRRDLPSAESHWTVPTGLNPLPAELRPRADAILARQLAAARDLATAMSTNRRQAAAAARIEVGDPGKTPPNYVDFAL